MATGRIVQEIALKILGQDDIKKVERQIDDLTSKKTEIKLQVEADTKEADRKLNEIDRQIETLETQKATVGVDASTAEADRKLDEINREIDSLKAERARVEVDADTSDADRKLDEIDRQVDALKKQHVKLSIDADTTPATGALGKLQGVAGKAFDFMSSAAGGFAVAGGAALGAFLKNAISDAEELALKAGEMRDALGLSAEEASRWVEVAGDVGVNADAIQKTFGKLILSIGKSPESFKALGLELIRTKDGAVDVNATILEVIDHLNRIEDPTRRAAEAQKLLGKSWQDVAELISEGSDSIVADLEAVSENKIKTDEDVAAARALRDSLDDLGDRVEDVSQAIGSFLIPVLTDTAGALDSIIGPATKVVGLLNDIPGVDLGQIFLNLNPGTQAVTRVQQLWGLIKKLGGESDDVKHTTMAVFDQTAEAAKRAATPINELIDRQKQWIATLEQSAAVPGPLQPQFTRQLAAAKDALADLEQQQRNNTMEAKRGAAVVGELATGWLEWAAGAVSARLAVQEFANVMKSADFGRTSFEGAISGMDKFNDQFFSLAHIASDTEEAFDNLSASLKENGKTFDLNTEAGRANQKAVEDMARAVDTQLIAAYDDAGGSFAEFNSKAQAVSNTLRDRLINEMGLSEQQADDLIARLGLMPKDIETRYKLSGDEAAKAQLALLQGSIDRLPKNVQAVIDYKILMGDYVGAVQTAQNYANRHPVTIPVELRVTTANLTPAQIRELKGADGFASAPYPFGIAGEAGPEFVRQPGRPEQLLTYPAIVPPGTRVTSVKRTRAILARGHGGRGPRMYASGGIVTQPVTMPLTVNVNAAVIGNRYDVAKAVGQGTRDLRRLVGSRGTSA